jgi:hypothetical protein
MTETRAVAKLPSLDIEILHREAPAEGAEYLSINLRATPDFATASRMLDPFGLLSGGQAFDPWRAWLRLVDPFGLMRAANPLLPGPRDRGE